MKFLTIFAAGAVACGALSTAGANAANLVANGGFETGDFTDWATDAVSYPMYIVTSPVEEGAYAAQIAGYSYGADTLTQSIATTADTDYTLSFWIYQQYIGSVTFLDVTWDGSTVFSMNYPDSELGRHTLCKFHRTGGRHGFRHPAIHLRKRPGLHVYRQRFLERRSRGLDLGDDDARLRRSRLCRLSQDEAGRAGSFRHLRLQSPSPFERPPARRSFFLRGLAPGSIRRRIGLRRTPGRRPERSASCSEPPRAAPRWFRLRGDEYG